MERKPDTERLRCILEKLYSRYNRQEFVHPDPLEFLGRYGQVADREIAGFVASGLAYGRVTTILSSIDRVLGVLGPAPSEFLEDAGTSDIEEALAGFRHRFTTAQEISAFLYALGKLQKEFGLLGNFIELLLKDNSYLEALDGFVGAVLNRAGMGRCTLLPRPSLGSACKRLHLLLRWMVRHDDVDPGGWDMVSPSQLIVPVDVHMSRAGRALGFTRRKIDDGRTASEITEGFRCINNCDPVKYDFAVTRFGIRGLEDDPLFRELFE